MQIQATKAEERPAILEQTQNVQAPPLGTRIAFVWHGEPGAYCESALRLKYADENKFQAVPLEDFNAVFEATESRVTDRAVVPIEDWQTGSVYSIYDLLLRHQDLQIIGEINYKASWSLVANKGVTLDEIDTVVGFPKALSQCSKFVQRLGARTMSTHYMEGSTSKLTSESARSMAAVVSPHSTHAADLEVLAEGIEDLPSVTRFLVLARKGAEEAIVEEAARIASHQWKTSIVFSLPNEPGILFKALSVFALRDIDLTKIESRPIGNGHYAFYLDLALKFSDESTQNALRHLHEIASWVNMLGSYPMDAVPESPSPVLS